MAEELKECYVCGHRLYDSEKDGGVCIACRAAESLRKADALIAELAEALEAARKQLGKQVTLGGPYPYINNTELVRDSYGVLGMITETLNAYRKERGE